MFEASNLALWSTRNHRNSDNAITAATLSCVAAISLVPILDLEHRHTLRPTAYVSAWLFLNILFDIVKARSLFLRDDLHTIGILTSVSCLLKAFVLALEEVSKKSLIKDEKTKQDVGPESTSGFLSRTLFLWVYKLFIHGFKNVVSLNDLDKLGPSFATQHVADQLFLNWNSGKLALCDYFVSILTIVSLCIVRQWASAWLSVNCMSAHQSPCLPRKYLPPAFFLCTDGLSATPFKVCSAVRREFRKNPRSTRWIDCRYSAHFRGSWGASFEFTHIGSVSGPSLTT